MLKTRVVLRITSVGKYNKINKVLGYSVLKKFDYITNCETELNNIKLINTNSRTICVRNALDTKSFYPDNKKVINKTIFTFGYLGRFSSEKNIELIIRSFSLLPYKIKNNSKLVLIGYKNNCCKECSNYYKIIYKLVESLNLQDDVIFKPAIPLVEVSKIRQEYQSFDTYILASKSEGLSNSVIESLACNTPVVCYKNNLAVREVIDKCDCEVFSKLTSKSLSKVLLTVYKDRKKDNGFNSANIVKSYYNLSIELKKCLNFLKLQPQ